MLIEHSYWSIKVRSCRLIILSCLCGISFVVDAATAFCPDPKTSSLQWGEIPPPWKISPFSPNTVQGDERTRFVNAQVLVAGYGQGVVCTYQYSLGTYSIWWQKLVRIPSPPTQWNWMDTNMGYLCSNSILDCAFSVGDAY